jgi:hypothetical protein
VLSFGLSRVVPETQPEETAMEQGTKREGAGLRQEPKKKDERLPENSKKNLDQKLDQAVEESFPASDPVSVKITK